MKRKNKQVITFILILTMVLSGFSNVNAKNNDSQSYLSVIRKVDSRFLQDQIIDMVSETELITPWGKGLLVNFIQDEKVVAYAIFVDGLLLEFSESESPYSVLTKTSDEFLYYDFANYSVIDKVDTKRVLESCSKESLLKKNDNSKGNWTDPEQVILSGVSPQLQGTDNCIVAALSNVIWYLKSHGYSALASGMTFTNVKTAVDALFPSYANDSVLTVANLYGSSHGNIHFSGGAIWSPSVAKVYTEINAGYPCMVGFAAGSVYSPTVGHMTMCYGYYYDGDSTWYVYLADGHSSNMVTRLWTSYNDCVIKLRIYWNI